MTTRMIFTRHLMSLLILAAAGSWASADIIEDFQADTPGSDPASADVIVDGVDYDIVRGRWIDDTG
ncbi:MAG: hypothetical protein GXP26_07245 [Planctomycetes bacterium]|nr:hypothetical protein [Planctomycetota bacterium]